MIGAMKIAIKTLKKIVLEVTEQELSQYGFDGMWDKIRKEYPQESYDVFNIERSKNSGVMFFELAPKELA